MLHFWTLLEGISDANPDVVHDDRKDCLILRFTGGTTGAAKAVMYSVDNFMASKDLHYASGDAIPLRGARLVHFGLISHASGIVFFPILFRGGCTITMNDRSLATWCRTVEREKATATLMVPSMLYRLLEAPEAREHDLSSLRDHLLRRVANEPGPAEAIARTLRRRLRADLRRFGARRGCRFDEQG